MTECEYTIGIDLGTSNCAVAFAPLAGGKVSDFKILQLDRPGEVRPESLLPSALYAPLDEEKGNLLLEWSTNKEWVVGRYARSRGAKVPGRLITSAKSWLCHPGVDRSALILPWGGSADAPKLSPMAASALLLGHMRDAWNHSRPQHPLAQQEVVITVPASFDEAARSLTVNAVRNAGIEKFTLLEEPQAAFYDFSQRHVKELARLLAEIRLVLVVDVGGGTTDFTLVQVAPGPGGPLLKRIAVGDHLILGGDNMDNALARRVEEKLGGKKLSSAQWIQIVQASREAKEKLLGQKAPEESKITIASEGSRLLGATFSTALTRTEVEELILEGFFPATAPTDFPKKAARGGIQEMGLPYVADPAIPRHLAAFLRKHAASGFEALGVTRDFLPRPDAVLLNGGVFNSERLAGRFVEILSAWWPERSRIQLLEHHSLDLAVARGAAYYGLVRQGSGKKISGGTAHSFYVGVATDQDEKSAVCLLPRGVEEGETVELKERVFKLHVGRPVQFPIYTSTADRVDRPGDLVRIGDEFTDLPPIQTVLKSPGERAEKIPVFLRARLTEIGTVELSCVSADSYKDPQKQWRLEFEIRGASSSQTTVTESLPARFAEAKEYIAKIYGHRPGLIEKGPKDVRQLWSSLEKLLGPRESWSAAVLRQLWGELFAGAGKRRRSAEHERIFFQLLGYSLRPGFGYSLDEWRCEQSFGLFKEGVEFHKEKPNWNEFWILWRRISGGLSAGQQASFWEFAKPHLAARIAPSAPRTGPPAKGPRPEGIEELVRACAALEHLEMTQKVWLGDLICARLTETKSAGGPWAWSLGRIGTRAALYGSAHNVVSPETAVRWLDALLSLGLTKTDGSAFAAAQIARATGDRLRDLDEPTRERVIDALRRAEAYGTWIEMVAYATQLQTSDEARIFGDSLPIGLQLVRNPAEHFQNMAKADHSTL